MILAGSWHFANSPDRSSKRICRKTNVWVGLPGVDIVHSQQLRHVFIRTVAPDND
jgi:hypothetical protein